jgi:hypothetical protein
MPAWNVPAPAVVGQSGHTTDHNRITAALDLLTAQIILPSGDTSGVTDTAAINTGLANGGSVQLVQAPLDAPYYINAPIIMSSQSRLWGTQWWSASGQDNYSAGVGGSGGSVILLTSSFSGNAGIILSNSTVNQYYGVDLAGFTLECYNAPGSSSYGILVDGAWGACFLRGVTIHRPPNDCLHVQVDVSTGFVPVDWTVSECKFSASRTGYGVYIEDMPNTWFTDCEASENTLDGWVVGYGVNSRWTSCKGENNNGNGFHFVGLGATEAQWLTGCSTRFNGQNGFLFDNSGGGGVSTSLYIMTGCVAQQDGQNSTSSGYAGFAVSGCAGLVAGDGCVSQVDIGNQHPQYGASQTNGSLGTTFTASLLQGTTSTFDDGTNVAVLIDNVPVGSTSGSGNVESVFGRDGDVVAQAGDYTVSQITGAAPITSPLFIAQPEAPTQLPGDVTAKLATTAYVSTAISSADINGGSAIGVIPPVDGGTAAGVPALSVNGGSASSTQTLAISGGNAAEGGNFNDGGGALVVSVFGRTGAITGQTGDYTAAQVGADPSGSAAAAQAAAEAASLPKSGGTLTGALTVAVVSLSQAGGSVAVNASFGNDFRLTLTASGWTISTPTNATDGQNITFLLTQDGTGSRTVTWAGGSGGYNFGSSSTPVLSTAASDSDLIAFKYIAALSSWIYMGITTGF